MLCRHTVAVVDTAATRAGGTIRETLFVKRMFWRVAKRAFVLALPSLRRRRRRLQRDLRDAVAEGRFTAQEREASLRDEFRVPKR
jgi:hypothetical protein